MLQRERAARLTARLSSLHDVSWIDCRSDPARWSTGTETAWCGGRRQTGIASSQNLVRSFKARAQFKSLAGSQKRSHTCKETMICGIRPFRAIRQRGDNVPVRVQRDGSVAFGRTDRDSESSVGLNARHVSFGYQGNEQERRHRQQECCDPQFRKNLPESSHAKIAHIPKIYPHAHAYRQILRLSSTVVCFDQWMSFSRLIAWNSSPRLPRPDGVLSGTESDSGCG